jgi:hypothetical protein
MPVTDDPAKKKQFWRWGRVYCFLCNGSGNVTGRVYFIVWWLRCESASTICWHFLPSPLSFLLRDSSICCSFQWLEFQVEWPSDTFQAVVFPSCIIISQFFLDLRSGFSKWATECSGKVFICISEVKFIYKRSLAALIGVTRGNLSPVQLIPR